MKRNIFSLSIIFCLVCVIIPLNFSGCVNSQYSGGDSHLWSDWTVSVAPTCTYEGFAVRVCEKCGKHETSTIPKIDHKMVQKHDETSKWMECIYCGYKSNIIKTCMTGEEVYNTAKSSVVEIHTFDINNKALATGSGFFISPTEVCTNFHVIEDAYFITLQTYNGTNIVDINITGYDKEKDIACIEVLNYTNRSYLKTDTKLHKIGEVVYTLGSSVGLTDTFSDGIIANNDRIINNISCYQITAPISPGNSSGPMLSNTCKVLGINSMTRIDGQNVNFAIKISEYNKLNKNKKLTPAQFYDETVRHGNVPDVGDLVVYEQEPNDEILYSQTLANGSTIVGAIANEYDYFDYYRLYITKQMSLTCLIDIDEIDMPWMRLCLIDKDDNMIDVGTATGSTLELTTVIPYTGRYALCLFRVEDDYPYPSTNTQYMGYVIWE